MTKLYYTFPNQKIITIHKAKSDKNNLYGIFNRNALFSACRTLTGSELKLYLYLCCNQSEYCFALSPIAISQQVGTHEDTVRTAVQGLTKKGYLVCQTGNTFDFYEYPELISEAETSQNASSKIPPEKMPISTHKDSNTPPIKHSSAPDKISREIINENKNSKINNKICLKSLSSDDEWEKEFDRIKVKFHAHTLKKLEEVLGKTPEVRIVRKIITENRNVFEKALYKQEGYRLSILVNLVKTQYAKWEYGLMQQDSGFQKSPEEIARDRAYSQAIKRLGDIPTKITEPEFDILEIIEEDWGTNEDDDIHS